MSLNGDDAPLTHHVNSEEAKHLFKQFLRTQSRNKSKSLLKSNVSKSKNNKNNKKQKTNRLTAFNCNHYDEFVDDTNATNSCSNSQINLNDDGMMTMMMMKLENGGGGDDDDEDNRYKIDVVKLDSSDAVIYTLRTFVEIEEETVGYHNSTRFYESNQSIDQQIGQLNLNQKNKSSRRMIACDKCDGRRPTATTLGADFLNNRHYNASHLNHSQTDQYNYPSQPFDYVYDSGSAAALTGANNQICEKCNGTGELEELNQQQQQQTSTNNNNNNNSRNNKVVNDCIYDVFVKCVDSSIPLKVLTKSKGSTILNQTAATTTNTAASSAKSNNNGGVGVNLINHFPDESINSACNELIFSHKRRANAMPNCKIVKQSHQLIAVPITTCLIRLTKRSSPSQQQQQQQTTLLFSPSLSSSCSTSSSSNLFKKMMPSSTTATTLRNNSSSSHGKEKLIEFKIIGENKLIYIPKRNNSSSSSSNFCQIS